MQEKILIITPSWRILGGVANHYMGLSSHWKENVRYLYQGKRPNIKAVFTLIPDYIKFVYTLLIFRPNVVIVNPSLRWYQLLRDSVYVIIALLFRFNVAAFIHGWNPKVADVIGKYPFLFRLTYGKSAFIYVLYSKFKGKLESFKIKAPVLLTTTKVTDSLLEGFDISIRKGKVSNILFLARLEVSKGILTALEAFKVLKEKYNDVTLSVCGTGSAEQLAKDYVRRNSIADVVFYGNVSGNELKRQFQQSDIYILPTHGEGMATSVLEAMAFGLPVLTSPVGGVNDFFLDGKMGWFIDPNNSKAYFEKIQWFKQHPEATKKCSVLNHNYAVEHFLASAVVRKFENDIKKCIRWLKY